MFDLNTDRENAHLTARTLLIDRSKNFNPDKLTFDFIYIENVAGDLIPYLNMTSEVKNEKRKGTVFPK